MQYATDAAANGWGEHCYDYIVRFEEAFKAHLGVKYAIATSICTGALHMGMHALGIGPGDEVIMANTNWIATATSNTPPCAQVCITGSNQSPRCIHQDA